MRYFMTINLPPEYDTGAKPVPQGVMDAMGPYVEKSVASGALISTGGLKRSRDGTRISGSSGHTATTDGPFTEAKEVVGGYAVLEAPSKQAAIALGAEFVQLHIDHGMPDIRVEVREIEGGYNY
jgi:hypothetical protein